MSRLRFSSAEAPAALVAGVERADVVTDVVADDHAVAQVVEKALQRVRFLEPAARLSSRVMPCTVTALGVPLDFQQRVEGVLEQDLVRRGRATAPIVMMRSVRGLRPVVSESSTTKRT